MESPAQEYQPMTKRHRELYEALRNLHRACQRYDENPDSTLSQATYENAKKRAARVLGEDAD